MEAGCVSVSVEMYIHFHTEIKNVNKLEMLTFTMLNEITTIEQNSLTNIFMAWLFSFLAF